MSSVLQLYSATEGDFPLIDTDRNQQIYTKQIKGLPTNRPDVTTISDDQGQHDIAGTAMRLSFSSNSCPLMIYATT